MIPFMKYWIIFETGRAVTVLTVTALLRRLQAKAQSDTNIQFSSELSNLMLSQHKCN